ncbi:MAG: hypothetical protein NC324_08615 [Bacteroides sp.]|nr:hypothetical protein [Bacteroides sp.]
MEEKEEKETPEAAAPVTQPEPKEGKAKEETPKEEPAPKSKWQELAERYAQGEVDSDEEAFEAIEEELEELTNWKKEEQAVNESLMDALNAEPDFQAMVGYILQGASFKEAIARAIDVESLTPAEGDPDRAGWEKAKGERIERLKKMEEEERVNTERAAAIDSNYGNTRALIDSFSQEHKLSAEEKRELVGKVAAITKDVLEMKLGEDILDMVFKSMRMNEIIEEAKEEGATEARNKKIEVMRQKRSEDTDGLPKLDTSPAVEPEGKQESLGRMFFNDVFEKHGQRN